MIKANCKPVQSKKTGGSCVTCPVREFYRLALGWTALALCVLGSSSQLWGQGTESNHPEKTMTAVRVNPMPPKIDGVLSDEVWKYAPSYHNFTQKDPDEGELPTERTNVQVAYDDNALYIGIMCYDSEPDKIVSRMGRRDQELKSDWVSISLDPHHDHQNGRFFVVGPSGWIRDGTLYDDTSRDDTWDGVWQAKTSVHDQGWSIEYKIPYHVLRFGASAEYIWGTNIERYITRKEEHDQWIVVPRGTGGWVSRLGHLEGIKGIKPPTHLEFLPFMRARATFESKSDAYIDSHELFSSVGMDLRYGLSPNISLNATFNPDFGQVETDPAVLNLSVFENFFEERRPFFIEGNTIFRFPQPQIVGIDGPAQLFYSRRIGKQPGHSSTPDGGVIIDRPDSTTILGAAKLSGKTVKKTSFSILEAITASEYATVEQILIDKQTGLEQTERQRHRIEPFTNFLTARVQQDLRTHSTIGGTITAVNRHDVEAAYVASIDGTLKWKENAYRIFTRLVGSRSDATNNQADGYEAIAYFSKFSGGFGGQLYLDARSPEFDANDLGFMNRTNRVQSGGHVYTHIRQPWVLARESFFNFNAWSHWNYDGVGLRKGINFNTWHNLKNYWFFNVGISREFEARDDLETRGGPVMVRPAQIEYWFFLQTDNRRAIGLSLDVFGDRTDGASSWQRSLKITTSIRPASNLQFELGPSYRNAKDFAQWVRNIDDDGDGETDHYVFGELRSQVLDFTTRATVAFTTNLTFQLYLQPFATVGNFRNFKELARPDSYDFAPYTFVDDNPDFIRRSLRSNMVLRWEYQPGSTLFAVWSQSRGAFIDVDNPEFNLYEGVRKSFIDKGDNVFLIKLNYWLGI